MQQFNFLRASFDHIEQMGWTQASFLSTSQALGEPALFYHLFPQGLSQTILVYGRYLDHLVDEKLSHIPFEAMGTTDKITLLVLTRLQLQRKTVVKALLKQCIQRFVGPKLLAQTVDHMWARVADQSTDFNYYTKRGILGIIYSNTLLYSLSQASDKQVESFFKKQLKILFQSTRTIKSGLALLRTCIHNLR